MSKGNWYDTLKLAKQVTPGLSIRWATYMKDWKLIPLGERTAHYEIARYRKKFTKVVGRRSPKFVLNESSGGA
ncbi:MAG: hypothetical protein ACTS4X_00875 [Candidatus Hodgkinia cicadicola]